MGLVWCSFLLGLINSSNYIIIIIIIERGVDEWGWSGVARGGFLFLLSLQDSPQGRQTSSCGNFLAALAIPVTRVSNGCEELNIEVESNVSFCVPILGTRKGTYFSDGPAWRGVAFKKTLTHSFSERMGCSSHKKSESAVLRVHWCDPGLRGWSVGRSSQRYPGWL